LSDHTDAGHSGLDIAVVGMAGRFPGARNVDELWENLCHGVEAIKRFTDDELAMAGVPRSLLSEANYIKAAGVLGDFDCFDASFFGYSPREASRMDPQQRIFLETAWTALESAAIVPRTFERPIGIYAGSGMNTYLIDYVLSASANKSAAELDYPTIIGNDKDFLTSRVSYKLGLEGPSVAVQTACSTSLVAIHLACQALISAECDVALAGGVTVRLPHVTGYSFQEEGIHSPDGHCRAFDASARGSVPGSGAAVVVLKRLADAIAERDTIHAVVKGTAINNDGSSKVGFTAPRVDGQRRVISDALEVAQTPADSIGYLEAHGTGTILGDPIEIEAVTMAFRAETERRNFCGVGSIKTNVGHLDAAAGVTGFIKAVLCVKHGLIPPSLHFRTPNPNIDFESSPFYVVDALREWPSEGGARRAGVSSFGIGGTNAHAIIEQPPSRRQPAPALERPQLIVISAKNETALSAVRDRLAKRVAEGNDLSLESLAYTLERGRSHFNHRSSFVAENTKQALACLRSPSAAREADPDARVGFLFPGQGAQYVNMGRGLYESEAVFRRYLDEGSELLEPIIGSDLRQSLFPSGALAAASERLDETRIAQPAIFLVSYALAKLWESVGVEPKAMLGHSIGEYVAACLAGVFSFSDALALVAERGRLMDKAPTGTMLAVSLASSELAPQLKHGLELAAVNASNLSVISGPAEAIARFETWLRSKEIEYRRLRTSHAFHSSSMDAVLADFGNAVAAIERRAPTIPYVSNLTGTWVSPAEATDPDYWVSHLRNTVRFSDGLAEIGRDVSVLLEVGPGRSLTSLSRREFRGSATPHVFASMRHPDEQRPDQRVWLESVGDLWSVGVAVQSRLGETAVRPLRIPLPTYPFERARYWIDSARDAAGAEEAPSKRPWERWFSTPVWQRLITAPVDSRMLLASDECWMVFEDAHGVGAAFVDRLHEAGRDVVRVRLGDAGLEPVDRRRFSVAPGDSQAYRELFRALEAEHFTPRHVIHFWNVEPDESAVGGADNLVSNQRRGFESILHLVQALGDMGAAASTRLTVVTTQAQAVLGHETLCAEKAMVLGPVRCAPLEYPGCSATAIDIVFPPPEGEERGRAVDLLLATVLESAAGPVLAIRGSHLWSQHFAPLTLDRRRRPPLERERVYLITGGTGGIGLSLAEHLARTWKAKLVLTTRTPLPERSHWDAWSRTSEESEFHSLLERLDTLDEQITASAEVRTMSSYDGLEASLDALCTAYALQLVASVGGLSDSDTITTAELAHRLGLRDELDPYFEMLVRGVCDDGFAMRSDATLRFVRAKTEWPEPATLAADTIDRYPEFVSSVRLVEHCLSHAGAVFRGEEDALAVLYGDGRELFRAGVEATLKHSCAATQQALIVELATRLAARERGRPLRVLEVGGGEGILTEALVEALGDHDVEYHFTDVGKSFVVQAEKKAADVGRDWMRFGLLDIGRSPIPQGFAAGQFDLVVAFNVVHATRRISETLAHLHRLLGPGGVVALQESVRPRRWVDCIWGLTEGWWQFEDSDLRSGSPLISIDAWQRALADAGFAPVASFPRQPTARLRADAGVIVGQKPESTGLTPETETTIRSRVRRLLSLERLGAEVELACADVTDRARMKEVVQRAEARFGRIDGVVHAALVLDDGSMQLKTRESFEKVLAPKVTGLLVLEELFRDRGLDFFAIFSSLVSVVGGSGQVDYCAASNFQDTFAHQHQGKLAKATISIDWAAWREAGKAAREAIARGASADDVLPAGMSTAEGIEAFEAALASSLPQVLVSPLALQFARSSSHSGELAETRASAAGASSESAPTLGDASADAPRSEAEQTIAAIWRELLGLDSIGLDDNFFEFGADSVVSLQFIARAKKEGFHFTNAQVFEFQTIAELLASDVSDDD
jgi:acyl transferase domain-containing protein/SAM-dependent methyltransferase